MADKAAWKDRSWYKVVKKLIGRKTALFGIVVFLLLVFMALFGNHITPYDPATPSASEMFQPPSATHLFGTDSMGRDMLSRVIDGAKITLMVSVIAVLIAMVIGTLLGLLSGYMGGVIDIIITRLIEAISVFPMILFALIITTILGVGTQNIMIAIGVAYVPAFTRIVRAMTLTVKEREYIDSAKVIGLNRAEILWRYVLPNVYSVIIVQASLAAAGAILSEAALGFMGVGVQPPEASWGSMLKVGYNYLNNAPWMSIVPGFAIVITVLALNLLGDGLRDALDVRVRAD